MKAEDGRGGGLQISLALMSFKLKENVEKWPNKSWRNPFDWSYRGFFVAVGGGFFLLLYEGSVI